MEDEETQLEKEFDEYCKTARDEIMKHIKAAHACIAAAEKVSEKTGIPFDCRINGAYNSFVPNSWTETKTKFSVIDEEDLLDRIGIYTEYGLRLGEWQHSFC